MPDMERTWLTGWRRKEIVRGREKKEGEMTPTKMVSEEV